MQIKARAVILDKQGRILLQKLAGGGFWCLPGGTFEEWEVLKSCLEREIQEELGVTAEIAGVAHVQSFVRTKSFDPTKNGTSVVDIWYFVENWQDFWKIDLSKASHGFETEQIQWFSADDFPPNHAPEYLSVLVREWATGGKRFLDWDREKKGTKSPYERL